MWETLLFTIHSIALLIKLKNLKNCNFFNFFQRQQTNQPMSNDILKGIESTILDNFLFLLPNVCLCFMVYFCCLMCFCFRRLGAHIVFLLQTIKTVYLCTSDVWVCCACPCHCLLLNVSLLLSTVLCSRFFLFLILLHTAKKRRNPFTSM